MGSYLCKEDKNCGFYNLKYVEAKKGGRAVMKIN